MKNESPLVPQGSFLEQKNPGRARVRIAVFVVLAIHGAMLMALLMQGCQKAPDQTSEQTQVDTNAPVAPSFAENTNIAPALPEPTNPTVVTETMTSPPPIVVPEPLPIGSAQEPGTSFGSRGATTMTTGTPTQHTIVSGDTFAKLAQQYKVSARAIEAANPGVNPSRLKISSVIQIPAPNPRDTASTIPVPTMEPAPAGMKTYKVKSGDNLLRIASRHGVSVKALKAANGLRTDRINVSQVLKIPATNGGQGSTGTAATTNPSTLGNP